MAVVQISKIQVRRGQKNTTGTIPQLSSAEFAWAVDTQELYIGNGSIAEGAPYVGNTKVITEHDNILNLASSYQFAYDDPAIAFSIPRSLQNKIDETSVSVKDFGAIGDGSTDCVVAFQTALTELFRNPNDNYKKVLLVPNGEYLFLSDLRIPSNAIIRGETKLNSVLKIGNNNILFITGEGEEVADFNSSNRPRNIEISNLTVQRETGQTVFTGVADSKISNVRFLGEYSLGNTVVDIEQEEAAVFWENTLVGIRTNNLIFENCEFESCSLGVNCDQLVVDISNPLSFDTNIEIKDCVFFECHTGILITTDNLLTTQRNSWKITDSKFEEIADRAIRTIGPGTGTKVFRCKFASCGNGSLSSSNPQSPIIEFGMSHDNIVLDSSFDRHQAAAITDLETKLAVTEVKNSTKASLADKNFADVYLSDAFRPLSVFSAYNRYTEIEYTLTLGGYIRTGKLKLLIDDDLSFVSLQDNFDYSAASATAPGGALMTNFEFSAELKSNDGTSGIDTMVLYYMNPLSAGELGTISYSVSYGV